MTDWSHSNCQGEDWRPGRNDNCWGLKQTTCVGLGCVLSATAEPGPTCDDGHSKKIPKLIEQSNW